MILLESVPRRKKVGVGGRRRGDRTGKGQKPRNGVISGDVPLDERMK